MRMRYDVWLGSECEKFAFLTCGPQKSKPRIFRSKIFKSKIFKSKSLAICFGDVEFIPSQMQRDAASQRPLFSCRR
jgi:hypothetical protein